MPPELISLTPTPFLRREGYALRQVARATVRHEGDPVAGQLVIRAAGRDVATPVRIEAGEQVVEAELAELTDAAEIAVELRVGGQVSSLRVPWQPPRHWVVHLVQVSHHDAGYTDLASHVVEEHDRHLDRTIELAAATRDYPEDARFRAVIEQAWSIDHFLHHAPAERARALTELLRGGDLEVTALFGNLTSELCGHETLARSVYHAFRLKRELGIPIVSAEHNDVPGFSWGLSQVLTEAGIRLFCPGLPKYNSWGHPGAASFWDEAATTGADGRPGAFWWEAPSGKRLLVWYDGQDGGGCDPGLSWLGERLQAIADGGYPWPVLRWPVKGGARDNSPYIGDYAESIRRCNERWAFPRLISSTNARFHRDLETLLPEALPVFRGELPGQDYPAGAASTALATGVNRRNHAALPAAESLATMAAALTDYVYQGERLFRAHELTLWHDEHTWGHHFPAGPTATTAELEKALHAHRAATLGHDVLNKAMARVADHVRLDTPGIHLVVFNPLPHERTGLMSTPMRELDNCGSTMGPSETGRLRGFLLHDRWHVNPPPELAEGRFDLVDVVTGEVVPFELASLDSPWTPVPYAAQRLGLGQGGRRYGFFEDPRGLRRELRFVAEDVPGLGYRTYRLAPREAPPTFPSVCTAAGTVAGSPFYRLALDPETGFVRSLIDRESGAELVDGKAAHPFGAVVVRDPHGRVEIARCVELLPAKSGPLTASVGAVFEVWGHPRLEITWTLHAREKRLEAAVAMLKDPTPLLESYLAFPFALPGGEFAYEGSLCVVDPARDLLPGAYADRLTAQNWVRASDGRRSILWSSLDAPVTSLGQLWPGRVSPAHSAVVRDDIEHPRQSADDLRGGAVYSLLTANNFGTNLSVSQSGALLFRYVVTSADHPVSDAEATALGQVFQMPMSAIFTKHPRPRSLPPVSGFLAVEPGAVQLLALKQAETAGKLVARLWNPGGDTVAARLELPGIEVVSAERLTLAEEATGQALDHGLHHVEIRIGAGEVATVGIDRR